MKGYDLTEGSVVGKAVRLSIPMVIANAGQSLYNIVDIYFVGKLGKEAVAAVATSGMFLMMIMTVAMGLSIATQAMVSRFFGAKEPERAQQAVVSAFLWGGLASIAIILLGILGAPFIFKLMGTSERVLEVGTPYLRIMFISMAFSLFMFIGNAAFHGAGNSKIPMFTGLLGVVLNIIFDPILIFGLGPFPAMGTVGAAYATLGSRFIGTALLVVMLVRHPLIFRSPVHHVKLDISLIKETFRIGLPGAAQMGIRSLSYLAFMRIASGFGTAVLAAMGIAFRINMFILLPTFAISAAVGSAVGQNLGAIKPDRAWLVSKKMAFLTAMYLWSIALIIIFLGKGILSHFLFEEPAFSYGVMFLMCFTLGYGMSAFGIILNGAARGAGSTFWPLVIIIIAYFMFAVPFAVLLSRTALGAGGVFVGYASGMIIYSLMILIYFQTGHWARKKIA